MRFVRTSYPAESVTFLLQDVKGKVPILDTAEREKLNQQGIHYSEMLPLEYAPTKTYMDLYFNSLDQLSFETASATVALAEKLWSSKGPELVLVSLARAGTPIGILVQRYLKARYGVTPPHYSISIIRGKGIDSAAMHYIVDRHAAENIQFIDGWVGKGAINTVLDEACQKLRAQKNFQKLDSELAALSDPASVTKLYGTRQDFLIPSACLNATVSGLVSRTVKLPTMTEDEFHGAIFYEENLAIDQSNAFLETVEKHFNDCDPNYFSPSSEELNEDFKGIDEVKRIAKDFKIKDINKIKPGVGETTRVLLRRVPDRILIRKDANPKYLQHILQLAEEKQVPVEYYPLEKYNVCGIIKELADL